MLARVEQRLRQVADAHFHKGEYNHSVNLTRIAIAIDPKDVDMYADSGYLLWSMGRDAEAEELYRQGIQANPHTYYMYDELGQYYALRAARTKHKEYWAQAADVLAKAATFPDVYGGTLHTLAHAYEHTGQTARALATWKRAVRDDKDPTLTAAARFNLARMERTVAKSERQGGTVR